MIASSKLRWQCRRGMRELDFLLEHYLQDVYEESTRPDKDAFRQLLLLSDPDLAGYLLRGERHDDALTSDVIERILSRAPP